VRSSPLLEIVAADTGKDLSAELVKPYKINTADVDQEFDLRHGSSVRHFPMDKVSNSPWTQVRLVKVDP
jgi:hypothetical protein